MVLLKRVTLFLLTNLLVLVVLGVVVRLLGVDQYVAEYGLDYPRLAIFAAIYGLGGSMISLLLSKPMAKMATRARVIETPSSHDEAWLLETVHAHARRVGIGMPEVAVYDSPDMNAFATGWNKDKALVAVSTGLLRKMGRYEIEAVLGHEVSHVGNGDMITLALMQGVLNVFVLFLSRVIGTVVDSAMRGRGDRRGVGPGYFLTVMVLQFVLGLGATLLVMWFSRWREYRADRGGAELAGRASMVAALRQLGGIDGADLPPNLRAFGIRGGGRLTRLFASHPSITDRIAALEAADLSARDAGRPAPRELRVDGV